jgi:hypothetical protein
MAFTYYSLTPPAQWKAGSVGTPPHDTPFYFNCADCDAKEPPIAGILSTDGTFTGLALLRGPDTVFVKPAMFCANCFEKRIACPDCGTAHTPDHSCEPKGWSYPETGQVLQ